MRLGPPQAVFRVDASVSIGGGHVRRCLVLADTLAEAGWRITFGSCAETLEAVPLLGRRLFARILLEEDDEPAELRRRAPEGCDLLVVDHYGRDAVFERACRGWASRILAIDDAVRRHDCDVLVDPTPGRTGADYQSLVPAACLVLAGSAYVLIDRRFRIARRRRRQAADRVGRIFVNFGSTDPSDATGLALEALARARLGVPADIVLGSETASAANIREAGKRLSPPAEMHVDVDDMAALMVHADLAIGAGGVSSLERCCLGLPSALLTVADNQAGNVKALAQAGAALDLGPVQGAKPEDVARALRELAGDGARRRAMSDAGREICDGLGSVRVVDAICAAAASDGTSMHGLDLSTPPYKRSTGGKSWWDGARKIAVVVDNPSWVLPFADVLVAIAARAGDHTRLYRRYDDIQDGTDVAFFLGCFGIARPAILARSRRNLVAHASDLPAGRGFAPLAWQIIAGKNNVPMCLIEAVDVVDAGPIVLKDVMRFNGTELYPELRDAQGRMIVDLCLRFLAADHPPEGVSQIGEPTVLRRRSPKDSELDPGKTIAEQFDLLRTVDNNKFPAFFAHRNRSYRLAITPLPTPPGPQDKKRTP